MAKFDSGLYHGAGKVGDGGTANAIREEKRTVEQIDRRFHSKKGREGSIRSTASSGETPTTPIARCSNGCATTLVTH